MREIADMRAGALDDLAVGVDQGVGLARQRLDLDRERAGELLGLAGADRRKPARNAVERRETEPHLEQRGEEQHRRQHQEGGDDGAVEGQHLVVEFGGVAADRDQEAAVVAEIDVALDQPQPLILRALHVALAAAVGIGRHDCSLRCGSPRSHSERDEVTSGLLWSSRVTCQYQPDSGSSNSGSPSICPVFSIGISGEARSAINVLR